MTQINNEFKTRNENISEIIGKISETVSNEKARSAWGRGVQAYALELADELGEALRDGTICPVDLSDSKKVNAALLNGADSWSMYSWGGSALIYDGDIATRLCCPSELKKTRDGERRPNSREEWLDVQARALYQAANMVKRCIRSLIFSGALVCAEN